MGSIMVSGAAIMLRQGKGTSAFVIRDEAQKDATKGCDRSYYPTPDAASLTVPVRYEIDGDAGPVSFPFAANESRTKREK